MEQTHTMGSVEFHDYLFTPRFYYPTPLTEPSPSEKIAQEIERVAMRDTVFLAGCLVALILSIVL
mgnify:CR=1 FL=1